MRVAWLRAGAEDRREMDGRRSAAHDVLIDSLNALSRRMRDLGEDNGWRGEIGLDRGEIGDFACFVHCLLGLAAR